MQPNPPLSASEPLPTMYDLPSEDRDEIDLNPPLPPHKTLPTMYDLPSEDPQESGLPDEFHEFQPQLLRETFDSPAYAPDETFIGTDINLYYDIRHPRWYKRPDWFVALGVPRANQQQDLRLSYLIWQEGVSPFLVVELLSPGTEEEDLGQTGRTSAAPDLPQRKWEVYEQILRVPYYVVFDRYTNQMRVFGMNGARYHELSTPQQRLWLEEIQLGLGVWQGVYLGVSGLWLRWYDASDQWLPTPIERAEQERLRAEQEHLRAEQEHLRAEQEHLRAERLAERLRALGEDPDLF